MMQNDGGSKRSTFRRTSGVMLPVALAAAVVPLAATAAVIAWGRSSAQAAAEDARSKTLAAGAELLARSSTFLLQADQVGQLRSLLMTAGRQLALEVCSVRLPDGSVIADADSSRVTIAELPATWDAPVLNPDLPLVAPGTVVVQSRLEIAERGPVFLLLVADPTVETAALESPDWLVLGGVLGGSMVAMLVVHAWGRRRMRPVAAVADAVLASGAGDPSRAALTVSPKWGAVAEAWNRLLLERDRWQRAALDHRVADAVASARAGAGSLERACDAMSQGVVVLDAGLNVRYANGAAGILLRTSRTDLAGKPMKALSLPPEVGAAVEAVASRGGRRREVVETSREDGQNKSVLRYSAVRAGQEEESGALLLVEDVTQQRVADQARDAFVAQATHELRTPLTNIRLYVESLLDDNGADESLRQRGLNVINTETRRLERMVSDMLNVSEIEAGSMKLGVDDVRVDALLEELRKDYGPQAEEKRIKLVFDVPPKLPVLMGDRDKLAMTIHNLIGNALKYTPEGGTVVVSAEETADAFIVRVRDTGIGIAPDETERIFEKFYRSKDHRIAKISGTGLGLALARDVARLHGGDVTLQSELNKGSTFVMSVPLRARAA